MQAYLDARKEIEDLKAEILTLRNAIATMVVKDSATKGRKRGPQQLDDIEDIEITDARFLTKIEKCGRWCLVFRACYVDKSHFIGLDKDSKFGLGDRIRFLDDDHKNQGITEDLRDAIPKKYHNLLSISANDTKTGDAISKVCCITYKLFVTELNLNFLQFRNGLSTGRSNFLKVLKEHASGIFDVPELTPAFPLEGRLDVTRIQFLIGYSGSAYSRFFPAIYLDEDDSQDEYLFRSEILYKVNFSLFN